MIEYNQFIAILGIKVKIYLGIITLDYNNAI